MARDTEENMVNAMQSISKMGQRALWQFMKLTTPNVQNNPSPNCYSIHRKKSRRQDPKKKKN